MKILYRRDDYYIEFFQPVGRELRFVGHIEAEWIPNLSNEACEAICAAFDETIEEPK